MSEEKFRCEKHHVFGIGSCEYCDGLDLYEVRMAWRARYYTDTSIQLHAADAKEALRKALESRGLNEQALVDIKVSRMETAEERESSFWKWKEQ